MINKLTANSASMKLLLVFTFFLASFLVGTIAKAQYMSSQVIFCYALCTSQGERGGRCPITTCSEEGSNNCTCSCYADNLSDGECSAYCDYPSGNATDSFCGMQ